MATNAQVVTHGGDIELLSLHALEFSAGVLAKILMIAFSLPWFSIHDYDERANAFRTPLMNFLGPHIKLCRI
jgi:hypothetical protein